MLFLSMGVVGFFGFYDETDSDILNNFDSNGIFGRAARLLLAVSMCFTYPVEAFVCRHVLTQVIYGEEEKERLEYLKADNKQQRCKMTLLVFCVTMVAVRIFHVGQCVGLPSPCSTMSTTEKPRCLNARRQENKRIDRFLEIQLHRKSSMSTASSFNYKWIKGNLVNTWEDSL